MESCTYRICSAAALAASTMQLNGISYAWRPGLLKMLPTKRFPKPEVAYSNYVGDRQTFAAANRNAPFAAICGRHSKGNGARDRCLKRG